MKKKKTETNKKTLGKKRIEIELWHKNGLYPAPDLNRYPNVRADFESAASTNSDQQGFNFL